MRVVSELEPDVTGARPAPLLTPLTLLLDVSVETAVEVEADSPRLTVTWSLSLSSTSITSSMPTGFLPLRGWPMASDPIVAIMGAFTSVLGRDRCRVDALSSSTGVL